MTMMKRSDPLRFWVELTLGAIAAVFFVVTSIWPRWIEAIFGADPDGGTGWTERAIAVSLAAAALAFLGLLQLEWRNTSKARRGRRHRCRAESLRP